jgi:thiol:disulfide interchange protein DsbC
MTSSVALKLAAIVIGVAICSAASAPAPQSLSSDPKQSSDPQQKAREAVVAKLKKLRPNLKITRVAKAPVPGMVSIDLAGGQQLYATEDGKYLFAGDLYEMGEDDLHLPVDPVRNAERRELMSHVKREDMVVFAPAHTKAVINVFTDVDCGYCRKLHLEVPRLNELGIEVRYLAFPRGGLDSPSYSKMVTAWCAADPNDTITRMKKGEEFAPKTCNNAVAAEYELGLSLGVSGTPAILLEDGRLLPGYAPAEELAKMVGI